jgi:hypothetical protein
MLTASPRSSALAELGPSAEVGYRAAIRGTADRVRVLIRSQAFEYAIEAANGRWVPS